MCGNISALYRHLSTHIKGTKVSCFNQVNQDFLYLQAYGRITALNCQRYVDATPVPNSAPNQLAPTEGKNL